MYMMPSNAESTCQARDGATQGSGGGDDPESERNKDPERLYAVVVPIRSFLKFLNSHVVSTTTIACECTGTLIDRLFLTLKLISLKACVKITA